MKKKTRPIPLQISHNLTNIFNGLGYINLDLFELKCYDVCDDIVKLKNLVHATQELVKKVKEK